MKIPQKRDPKKVDAVVYMHLHAYDLTFNRSSRFSLGGARQKAEQRRKSIFYSHKTNKLKPNKELLFLMPSLEKKQGRKMGRYK